MADILITGGTGFLGKYICKSLSNIFNVSLLGRSSENDIIHDLSRGVKQYNKKFEHVIHVAGKAHVMPKDKFGAQEFFKINLRGSINLIESLNRSGKMPQSFTFISSVSVYGKKIGEELDESCLLLGDSPYAKSKIEAEKVILDWSKRHDVPLLILRLPLIVGKNPPGNLGAMIKWMKMGLYFGIGKGEAQKSMVLAQDVAQFLPTILGREGIYNLSDGVHPTMIDFEETLAKMLDKPIPMRLPYPVIKLVANLGEVLGENFPINSSKLEKLTSTLTYCDSKARQNLGWKPRPVLSNLGECI